MRKRVKKLVAAIEFVILSPLLPAAAVALIALFTVSLAMAEPQVLAARGDAATMRAAQAPSAVVSDAISDNEAALFRSPLSPPHYHDRYRFYHRYDRYKARLRSGLNPGP